MGHYGGILRGLSGTSRAGEARCRNRTGFLETCTCFALMELFKTMPVAASPVSSCSALCSCKRDDIGRICDLVGSSLGATVTGLPGCCSTGGVRKQTAGVTTCAVRTSIFVALRSFGSTGGSLRGVLSCTGRGGRGLSLRGSILRVCTSSGPVKGRVVFTTRCGGNTAMITGPLVKHYVPTTQPSARPTCVCPSKADSAVAISRNADYLLVA